ncbi:hypothetical protein AVEN_253221-1 [Araneus ventricosus]|uniref:Uncharacterized protein n=1 Tax=Araneus ventricosus TaxID=182803 RepID=A0A4Y2WDP7_ARAVE|nr:hypothetical protein AVEN_253221-1 [Araneus ventricosus]
MLYSLPRNASLAPYSLSLPHNLFSGSGKDGYRDDFPSRSSQSSTPRKRGQPWPDIRDRLLLNCCSDVRKQLVLQLYFQEKLHRALLETLLCSLCYHTANGCPHARRSSEFTLFTEIIARIPKSSFPAPSSTLPLIQKSDVVPSFSFIAPSRAKGQAFFHWQGIETKSN